MLSSQHASLHDVGNRSLSKSLTKRPKEVARAEPNETGEVPRSECRVEFFLDVTSQTPGLPRRETALQMRTPRGSVLSPAEVDSEQHRRAPNAFLCDATIGVQCDSRGLQKARQ